MLGYVLRAPGEWSGELMTAEYEDLQESEASEIHVRSQEVFVKAEYEFPCANGASKKS